MNLDIISDTDDEQFLNNIKDDVDRRKAEEEEARRKAEEQAAEEAAAAAERASAEAAAAAKRREEEEAAAAKLAECDSIKEEIKDIKSFKTVIEKLNLLKSKDCDGFNNLALKLNYLFLEFMFNS